MPAIEKILFPPDFSERCAGAAPYVEALANLSLAAYGGSTSGPLADARGFSSVSGLQNRDRRKRLLRRAVRPFLPSEPATEIGRSGGRKDRTGRAEGSSGRLSRRRFGRQRF
jgi:hypothetical protein